jgi:hypothetical protein
MTGLALWIFAAAVIVVLAVPLATLVRGIGTRSQAESALPFEHAPSRSVRTAVVVAMALLIALLLLSVWMGRRAVAPKPPITHASLSAALLPAAGE